MAHFPRPRFFLAGIIQGSIPQSEIHPQNYRHLIRQTLTAHFPESEVYCPIEHHPDSLSYPDGHGRKVFFSLMDRARRTDVLIAYLPEASMGTAIEMWQAHEAGRLVITISALSDNWVVKFLSHRVVPDIEAFRRLAADGELAQLIEEHFRLERSQAEATPN